jgi:excinuclease UvrABC nuclease subunit
LHEINYRDGRRQVNNGREKQVCFGESLKDDDILKIIDDKDAKATKNVTAETGNTGGIVMQLNLG